MAKLVSVDDFALSFFKSDCSSQRASFSLSALVRRYLVAQRDSIKVVVVAKLDQAAVAQGVVLGERAEQLRLERGKVGQVCGATRRDVSAQSSSIAARGARVRKEVSVSFSANRRQTQSTLVALVTSAAATTHAKIDEREPCTRKKCKEKSRNSLNTRSSDHRFVFRRTASNTPTTC